jgi:hypothetical protein
MCAFPAQAVTDFETKVPKTDRNGELLHSMQVVALTSEGAEVIKVIVPGEPRAEQGVPLKVDGLVASPWTMGDRSGVSFRATRIETMANGTGRPAAKTE